VLAIFIRKSKNISIAAKAKLKGMGQIMNSTDGMNAKKRKAPAATEALRTAGQTFNNSNNTKPNFHNQDICACSALSSCVCELVKELIMLDAMEDYDRRIAEQYSAEGGFDVY
jgi:hypothetical protein